jgi:hypothetical protein
MRAWTTWHLLLEKIRSLTVAALVGLPPIMQSLRNFLSTHASIRQKKPSATAFFALYYGARPFADFGPVLADRTPGAKICGQ